MPLSTVSRRHPPDTSRPETVPVAAVRNEAALAAPVVPFAVVKASTEDPLVVSIVPLGTIA